MEPYVLPLFLLGVLFLTEIWAGSHSLKYFYTVMSRPGLAEPKFIAVTYVDDQQVLGFDSDSASQRMEPRTPWINRETPDYWERETRISREATQRYRMCLQKVPSYYNHSEGGVRTYQRLSGCEVFSNGSFSRGFVQYAYNGQDYLALDPQTLRWTAGNAGALSNKRKWEADQSIAEYWKVYMEEECVYWLLRHLQNGKETLLRTDPPSVQVTRHTSSGGEVTLRCRAQGFYPAEISLTWLRDGEEQLQDAELIETRPAGDGTFQKWAAMTMLSGSEQKYTCRVQHEGLPGPLFLKWEPKSSTSGLSAGVIAALLFIAVIVGVVLWRKYISDGKKGSYAATASSDSAQGSDVSLSAKDNCRILRERTPWEAGFGRCAGNGGIPGPQKLLKPGGAGLAGAQSPSGQSPILSLGRIFQTSPILSGCHSMKYFDSVVIGSRLGLEERWFTTVGYVDDQQFVRFHSDSRSQNTAPRGPWIELETPDYWERETRHLKDSQHCPMSLQNLHFNYNQSNGGVHTLQRLYGCKVFSNGSFSTFFLRYGYNGEDKLYLEPETLSWIALDSVARNIKIQLDADRSLAERWKALLQGTCVQWLLRHLETGKKTLLRTDPPSVRVTRHMNSDGEVTLKCRAWGFYPAEISLIWLRDGQDQIQDTENIETRPGGDGTFQTWAAVGMPFGNEEKYTCRVQHEGLLEPLSLKWESHSASNGPIVGIIAVFLLLTTVITGVVIWKKCALGGKGGNYSLTSENDGTQESDVSLTARETRRNGNSEKIGDICMN
ncbi:uncharacterized protein LOC141488404 [Macrotis lagotis]|uniref:uncharacterized protein LOC141488404 n=1 Tax=Macrotis lagotis TaxID=92651 RepID=UPI003D69C105